MLRHKKKKKIQNQTKMRDIDFSLNVENVQMINNART